jgi:hypothetical protein
LHARIIIIIIIIIISSPFSSCHTSMTIPPQKYLGAVATTLPQPDGSLSPTFNVSQSIGGRQVEGGSMLWCAPQPLADAA